MSRMRGAIPPLPHYAFMTWCSVTAQGQLYLYLYLELYVYHSETLQKPASVLKRYIGKRRMCRAICCVDLKRE
jgi:hypothetical protein